jgi:Iap family predicted aminopeptidase
MFFEENLPRNTRHQSGRYETAEKKGASGILAIHTDKASNGVLVGLGFGYSSGNYTIPVIRISQKTADSLLKHAGTSTAEMPDALNNGQPAYRHIPVNVSASVYVRQDSIHSDNIIAYLPGRDSAMKNEYIVVGAHHDHLGTVKVHTVSGERQMIYYGADDNASGVAGILELAEKLASGGPLKRSVIFMTFGAEEDGLRGSRHLCENLPVPASAIKLMINLDMIGRLDSCKLFVNTVDGGVPMEKTLKTLSVPHTDLNLICSPNRKQNSDHYPFYEKNIPVVMFTTGTHKEYHTPNDTVETINYAGEKHVLNLMNDLIAHAAEKQIQIK